MVGSEVYRTVLLGVSACACILAVSMNVLLIANEVRLVLCFRLQRIAT
jgi:hypothetical protein